MKKNLIREQAEKIHKMFNAKEITYEEAIRGLNDCGFPDHFNQESQKLATKFKVRAQAFSAWHYLHRKVVYIK